MAQKIKSIYVCSNCGCEFPKWYGKCTNCGEWNTLNEEIKNNVNLSKSKISTNKSIPILINDINTENEERYYTGIKEFDRVLGGGIVKGSLVLIGGDPGIGKSTILLQICDYLSKNLNVLYVSGEESKRQLKLRASRLGVCGTNLYIMTETDISYILDEINSSKPHIVVIDSIQTISSPEINSSPGTITQVKECTNALARLAKITDIPIIIVGHVNKDGAIAGPKVLEHMVDAVIYFEGDKHMSYRVLRSIKNRYGSTNEIGVFQMLDTGLQEVENPSLMLLSGRLKNVSGTCVTCVMEGSRPIMAEIQGLATSSGFGNPRRMSTGFDYNRVSLLIAVLEKRAGYFFSNLDTYINVVGGMKLDEPSADLAVAISLISSLKDIPIHESSLTFGEIGLSGEIRSVSRVQERISEATRLGFKRCIVPYYNLESLNTNNIDLEVIGVKNIRQAFEALSN